jgi:Tfp pilus assembly protein PilV
MSFERKKNQQGQSLIEMLFIIVTTFLLLSGLVVSMIFMIRTVSFAKNKAVAVRLAEEKLEQIKANKQLADFWSSPDLYGCGDEEEGLADNASFYRNTTCSVVETSLSGGKNRIEVTVAVGWQGGEQSEVAVSTYLSDWEE